MDVRLGGSTVVGGATAFAGVVPGTATGDDSNEKTLWSYAIPANVFTELGKAILRATILGRFAQAAVAKKLRVYLASTLVAELQPGDVEGWEAVVLIVGSTSQQAGNIRLTTYKSNAPGTPLVPAGLMIYGILGVPADNAQPLILSVTGQTDAPAAGAITAEGGFVEILNAA